MTKLEKRHIDFMNDCAGGATIWDFADAEIAREIQRFDPSFLKFIEDMDELGKYDPMVAKLTGVERMPYFGCLLLHDGFSYIGKWESENK